MASSIEPRRLASAEHVDQTLLAERHRIVLIRFGRSGDPSSAAMDLLLHDIAYEVSLCCVMFSVDLDEVREFTDVYELHDPCTVMCFYRNRPLPLDVGFGPDVKVTWPLPGDVALAEAIVDAVQEPAGSQGSAVRSGFLGLVRRIVQGLVA